MLLYISYDSFKFHLYEINVDGLDNGHDKLNIAN